MHYLELTNIYACTYAFFFQFREPDFTLRTIDDHLRHCVEIETSAEASVRYGVNRKSILTQLQFFNICSGALIPDVMHDVLEGVLQYETKLILSHITSCHYISLSHVNHLIECIELGYMEVSSRPSTIVLNMDDKHLKQNGMKDLHVHCM